jgi:phosphate transport system protein
MAQDNSEAKRPAMDSEHIVHSYDDELNHLQNLIAEMGGLAEMQLARAVSALVKYDTEAASDIVEKDVRIDSLEADIDTFAVRLIAKRQPMATDLRTIITGLKIAANLERIGDYAKNIAKRTVTISAAPGLRGPISTIARMAALVQDMIKSALDAYIARDADKADDVCKRDQEVDQIHSGLFRELLTYMMEDPRYITPCTHLLFIAKNMERIGDHVTNVAEQVHYMVHGEMPLDERKKNDVSSFTQVEPQ